MSLSKSLYPFHNHYIKLKSKHKMHYLDEGKGPPLIMVHGNPTWSFFYRDLVREFSKSYRVIVPDHIGCGFSDKPQDYAYTLKNHIENLNELVEYLQFDKTQQKLNMIVHDWGGAIGFGMAKKRPQKFEKIVILNTAAYRSRDIPFAISSCRLPIIGEQVIRRFNGFAKAATYMAVKNKLPKDVAAGFLHPYNNYKNRIATWKFVLDIPMHKSHQSYKTLTEVEQALPMISGEKMILWGGQDFCFNMTFFKRWTEIYPQAKQVVLEKAGHYLLEDAKLESMAALKGFL